MGQADWVYSFGEVPENFLYNLEIFKKEGDMKIEVTRVDAYLPITITLETEWDFKSLLSCLKELLSLRQYASYSLHPEGVRVDVILGWVEELEALFYSR